MEYAQVWIADDRKARKNHYCESGCKISKGEQYWYVHGIDSEGPFDFKLCAAIRTFVDEYNEQFSYSSEERVYYGEMWDVDWSYEDLYKLLVIMQRQLSVGTRTYLQLSHRINVLINTPIAIAQMYKQVDALKKERSDLFRWSKERLSVGEWQVAQAIDRSDFSAAARFGAANQETAALIEQMGTTI